MCRVQSHGVMAACVGVMAASVGETSVHANR